MGTIDPQMAASLAKMAEIERAHKRPDKPTLADARRFAFLHSRWFNDDAPNLKEVRESVVPLRGGATARDVPVRLYFPHATRPAPALVYFHGGGWFNGSNDTHDRAMRLMAQASGCAVVGIDYALAPEHKFPKPMLEATAVLEWLAQHGDRLGLDRDRLAVGGCSAGANLALAALTHLSPMARGCYRAATLYYGSFTGREDTESVRLFGGGEYGISNKDLLLCWRLYLENDAQKQDPRATPINAELRGLPFVFLAGAGLDPLRDDSILLAERLRAAGVAHQLKMYEGLCHSFLWHTRLVHQARTAIEDAAAVLQTHVLRDKRAA